MIPIGPVVARARVSAPRVAVWEFLIDPTHRANWWPEVKIDPKVGGVVSEYRELEDEETGQSVSGEIDVFVRGHAIGFMWHEGEERDTSVLLTLRSHGSETGVTVTESGFDALPSPAEKAAAALADWEGLVASLAESVEEAVAGGFVVAEEAAVIAVPAAEASVPEAAAEEAPAEEVPVAEVPADAESVEELESPEVLESVETAAGDSVAEDVETDEADDEAEAEAAEELPAELDDTIVVARPVAVEEVPVESEDVETAEVVSVETSEAGEDPEAEIEVEVEPEVGAEVEVEATTEEEAPEQVAEPASDHRGAPRDEFEPDDGMGTNTRQIPVVLPGPPVELTNTAERIERVKDPAGETQVEGDFSTGDPDFDALLRGE